jgi:transposase
MSETKQRYDNEFKKNAVKQNYESNKTVKEIAGNLGISVSLLNRLEEKIHSKRRKNTICNNERSKPSIKLENAELKIERDMLKKAAAYFAKNQK